MSWVSNRLRDLDNRSIYLFRDFSLFPAAVVSLSLSFSSTAALFFSYFLLISIAAVEIENEKDKDKEVDLIFKTKK